jgi:hypothetical protein
MIKLAAFRASGSAYMKLQIDEEMWNGFDFYYFYLDRINRIYWNFFACGEGPFGQRPYNHIRSILLILSENKTLMLLSFLFDQTGRFSGQRLR